MSCRWARGRGEERAGRGEGGERRGRGPRRPHLPDALSDRLPLETDLAVDGHLFRDRARLLYGLLDRTLEDAELDRLGRGDGGGRGNATGEWETVAAMVVVVVVVAAMVLEVEVVAAVVVEVEAAVEVSW